MSEFLTFQEKVEALASATPSDMGRFCAHVTDAVVDEMPGKSRLSVHIDIRERLAQAIKDTGVTQMQVASALGIRYQNLSHFLRGRIPLPLRTIEEILFLLDGKMTK